MIAFLVLLTILLVIVVGVEVVARTTKLPFELTRKLTHILSGTTVAVGSLFTPHLYIQIIGLLFIAVILVSRYKGIFRSIHDSERSGLGELWYPVGIVLASVFFSGPTFAYAVLVLAVSDGLAGLVGKLFGKRKIGFISAPKTYLGSGVFFVSALLLSLLVLPLPVALGAALFLTIIELLSLRGLDNVILPLAAGIIVTVYT